MTEHIGRGLHTALFNSRGVTWRGHGGDQERELATKYAHWAQAMEYTLAMLGEITKRRKSSIDCQRIWSAQSVDEVLLDSLAVIAASVNEDITHPPQAISNISEWAKKDGCWARLVEHADAISAALPDSFWSSLVSLDENRHEAKTARQTQKIDNGIEAQRFVMSVPAASWAELSTRLAAKRLATPKEIGILNIAAQLPGKIPTERQCMVLIEILEKGRHEGL